MPTASNPAPDRPDPYRPYNPDPYRQVPYRPEPEPEPYSPYGQPPDRPGTDRAPAERARGKSRGTIMMVAGVALLLGVVAICGVVFLNSPGRHLAGLLQKGDYPGAAVLLAEKPGGMGVAKALDAFALTFIADAGMALPDDVNYLAKYDGVDVLKSALAGRLADGADAWTVQYGAGTISEERCRQSIRCLGAFGMLDDGVVEALLADVDAIGASREALARGNECLQNGDYKRAMLAFLKIVPKDTESAARAVGPKQECRNIYFDGELARIKDLYNQGQYIAAFQALAQLDAFFPGEDAVTALLPAYEQKKNEVRLVDFDTTRVEHIFTHCLVAFPELSISRPGGGTYDKDCLTATEFKRLLDQLHGNNYILIDINSIYEIVDGRAVMKSTVQVPEGRKPLIFSFDDVVYDPNKFGKGMVDKLVIKDGRVQSYTRMADGREIYSTDNEFIPIMDDFVDAHPDFSWNGARGTLCMTGFSGILGYRTQAGSPDREAEIEAVRPIVEMLKDTGWNFANHGYGHYNMPTISDSLSLTDIRKWQDEVASLVGTTCVYVYAYGAWVGYDTVKHQHLMDAGYRVFCGVGANHYFIDGFPKVGNDTGTIFMDRRPMDGFDLRERGSNYRELMDTNEVYDHEARYIKFWETLEWAEKQAAANREREKEREEDNT